MAAPNFGVKLVRPGFGPAAELPTLSPAWRRHGGCTSPLGSTNVIGGNRRAAQASACGTGRTAYTKNVSQTDSRCCYDFVVDPFRRRAEAAEQQRPFRLTIEPGFVHFRGIQTVLDRPGQALLDEYLSHIPTALHERLKEQRVRNAYVDGLLQFCIAHGVPTLGGVLAEGSGRMFCSTEKVIRSKAVWNEGLIVTRLARRGNTTKNVRLEYSGSHFCATTVRTRMEIGGAVSIIAVFDREDSGGLVFRPLVIGFESVTSDDPEWADELTWLRRDYYEMFIQEFDEFAHVSTIPRPKTLEPMKDVAEAAFKRCLGEILGDSVAKDWGGEVSDHFTANLHVARRPLKGAFLLKGPSRFAPMRLNHLGKNNDQIYRLSHEPADVLFVQHSHEVTPEVRGTLRAFAVQPGNARRFCIIDGRDSLWLLKAFKLYDHAVAETRQIRSQRRKRAG